MHTSCSSVPRASLDRCLTIPHSSYLLKLEPVPSGRNYCSVVCLSSRAQVLAGASCSLGTYLHFWPCCIQLASHQTAPRSLAQLTRAHRRTFS